MRRLLLSDGGRLSFAVGVLEIGYGILLIFAPAGVPARAAGIAWMPTLLLLGGVSMLFVMRYPLRGWRRNAALLSVAAPLLLMAYVYGSVGSLMSGLVYVILAGTVLLVGVQKEAAGSQTPPVTIFEFVWALLCSLLTVVLMVAPELLPSGTVRFHGLMRPLSMLISLCAGGVLLGDRLSRVHPSLPRAARLTSAALLLPMAVMDLTVGFHLGVLFKLAFGAALLFRPSLVRREALPEHPAEIDRDVEGATELWNWLLVFGAALMTALQKTMDQQTADSLAYAITALVIYNIGTFWLLPGLGRPDSRLRWHLHIFAIATAYLSQVESQSGYAMVAFSLVPPILAARALGRSAGYGVLATNLGFFLFVALERELRYDGGFLNPTRVAAQCLGVGVAGLMVIRNALEQRHLSVQLQGAREELQAANEELQAANEELLAQNEELTDAGEALAQLAERDPLTGLFNRRSFLEWLQGQLSAGCAGALLFLDLDHFKEINDNGGHAAGDQVLQRVSQVLLRTAGERATIARFGGDEFAVMLPGADAGEARARAEQILRQLGHLAPAASFPVEASIGITLYPEQANTVEALLVQADTAMYEVKRSGRNGVFVYQPRSGVSWELEVQRALAEGRFVLHFQPIVDLRSGTVTRYEALLRMVGPDGRLVPPGLFLPHVESGRLMSQVDRWVIREAFRYLQGPGQFVVEVNLSGRAFDDPTLLESIEAWLVEMQVDPRRLIFEITETAAISDVQRARRFIQALRRHGCRFAIDDLGSGFASFSYLKHLPVDYIKIDGSLIKDLREVRDRALVEGIVTIGRGLGMQTIAEWVEDAETLELVRQCGVDYAQGYLIGYPSPFPVPITAKESSP
ncbi:MAG TPA: EAL domain-containing protein [Symbiobacteriaceae bacterium]|nr:EAL domain-containing protein [Symbiobacteriaceae bacterium]